MKAPEIPKITSPDIPQEIQAIFPLAFRTGAATLKLPGISSILDGQATAIKQVMGWAMDEPDVNAETLEKLDRLIPYLQAYADFAAGCDLPEKDVKRWRSICQWYADKRGWAKEPAIYPCDVSRKELSAAKKIGLSSASRYNALVTQEGKYLFADGTSLVAYNGSAKLFSGLNVLSQGDEEWADENAKCKRLFELYFTLGFSPDAYAESGDFREIDVAFDWDAVATAAKMEREAEPYIEKELVPLADASTGDKITYVRIEWIQRIRRAIRGRIRAFVKADGYEAKNGMILFSENAVAILMPTPVKTRENFVFALRPDEFRPCDDTRPAKAAPAKSRAVQKPAPVLEDDIAERLRAALVEAITRAIGNGSALADYLDAVGF